MGLDARLADVQGPEPVNEAAPLILLDTHALLWLDQGHVRARALARETTPLYLSPATLLELAFLEAGKLRRRNPVADVTSDARWTFDDPPSAPWFQEAIDLTWTRDPFERLLAAHARLRSWRLATADATLLQGLGRRYTFEL